jgi:hypothetical protein
MYSISRHHRACLALDLAAFDRLPLVVQLFSPRERQRHLDLPPPEVKACGNQGQPLFGRSADELSDLFAMQEHFPAPLGIVIDIATMTVRIDVDVVQPDLSRFNARKAVPQVRFAFANPLYLGAEEHESRLERLKQVVVVKRLAVFRNQRFPVGQPGPHRTARRAVASSAASSTA